MYVIKNTKGKYIYGDWYNTILDNFKKGVKETANYKIVEADKEKIIVEVKNEKH